MARSVREPICVVDTPYFANMPWPNVKCDLNYKERCPGIIYSKDLANFRKMYKCRAPKKRTEVGTTGMCWTCANAQRSEVSNARRRNKKRTSERSLEATVGSIPACAEYVLENGGGGRLGGGYHFSFRSNTGEEYK